MSTINFRQHLMDLLKVALSINIGIKHWVLILYIAIFSELAYPQIVKMPLNQAMVTNESGDGNATFMVDEQIFAGDPLNGISGIPVSNWNTSYDNKYPKSAIIDFGITTTIKYIFIFDTNSSGELEVSAGSANNWTPLFTDPLKNYNIWKKYQVNISTRFLRVTKKSVSSNFSEILVYVDSQTIPPPSITNLSADSVSTDKVFLSWNDVAGNIATGILTNYDLRLSESEINAENFEKCQKVEIPFSPDKTQKQHFTLTNMASGKTYYIALKLKGTIKNTLISNIIKTETYYLANQKKIKIDLSNISVFNETLWGNIKLITDEQSKTNDLLNEPGGNPITAWETGYESEVKYPVYGWIDLKKAYVVKDIFLRDVNNNGPLEIQYGYPGKWNTIITDNLNGYISWNHHQTNVSTRYLRFGKFVPGALISEAAIYGIDLTPGIIDSISPNNVSNITVVGKTDTTLTLEWTCSGDNDTIGTAIEYDIRYSRKPFDQNSFFNIPNYISVSSTKKFGEKINQLIPELNPGTDYYFSIKARDQFGNFSKEISQYKATTADRFEGKEYFIPLKSDMLTNEKTFGNANLLVDEQDCVLSSGQKKPSTYWIPGGANWVFPASVIIDLKGRCKISEIWLYNLTNNNANNQKITIQFGKPFAWTTLTEDSLKTQNDWTKITIPVNTRYLRLEYNNSNVRLAEVAINGLRLEPQEEEPQTVAHQFPLMGEFIGANAFVDDPLGRLNAVGFVREYHNWSWSEGNSDPTYTPYPNNKIEFFRPMLGWSFDNYYKLLKKSGIICSPAIQGSVIWLYNNDRSKLEAKAVPIGSSTYLPQSYAAHASFLYQYAARYGSTKIDKSILKIDTLSQIMATGLKTVNYIENWNEQDKWWRGEEAFYSPYEFAAMTSADYDGHLGSMGPTIGIKNADPNTKLAMGGLASASIDYIKGIKLWCDTFRYGNIPFDAINLHIYCNSGYDNDRQTVGVSPEDGNLKERMLTFTQYRDKYMPGKEFWVTEFGYDMNFKSVQKAPNIDTTTAEEVQGQWLLRSYLELSAAGVDKAAMYMLRDVDPNSEVQYNSSGLTNAKGDWTPKTSWYYTKTMKTVLNKMRYAGEIKTEPGIKVYKYKTDNDSTIAFAIWSPTSNNTIIEKANIQLDELKAITRLVEPKKYMDFGELKTCEVTGNAVRLQVSEKPVFIVSGNDLGYISQPLDVEKIVLTPSMVTNEPGFGNAGQLCDEQTISLDPYLGKYGEPTSTWFPGYQAKLPATAIIDLGKETNLAYLYFRDMNSNGNVKFEVKKDNQWVEFDTDDLKRYLTWTALAVNEKSRYIRITLTSLGCNISEIILYRYK